MLCRAAQLLAHGLAKASPPASRHPLHAAASICSSSGIWEQQASTQQASSSSSNTSRGSEPASPASGSQQADAHAPQPTKFSTAELYTDANANVPLKSAQYASSFDDPFGVQRNWFTALYKQLNYVAKTGAVPALSGRQKEVFQQASGRARGSAQKRMP